MKVLSEASQIHDIEFRIVGPGGELCTVSGEQHWTLGHVKNAIEDKLGIPSLEQRLIHGVAELRTAQVLKAIGCDSPLPCQLVLLRRLPEQAKWLRCLEEMGWQWLIDAPEEATGDREVALAAVSSSWMALHYLDPQFWQDRDVVLIAAAQCGTVLADVDEELQHDFDIVMAAVTQCGLALEYAAAELRGNREIVIAAVSQNGCALEFAAEECRCDHEVVMLAVQQDSDALEFAEFF